LNNPSVRAGIQRKRRERLVAEKNMKPFVSNSQFSKSQASSNESVSEYGSALSSSSERTLVPNFQHQGQKFELKGTERSNLSIFTKTRIQKTESSNLGENEIFGVKEKLNDSSLTESEDQGLKLNSKVFVRERQKGSPARSCPVVEKVDLGKWLSVPPAQVEVPVPSKSGVVLQQSSVRVIPKPIQGSILQERVVAVFPYMALDKEELSFDQGNTIVVLSKDASGWWKGKLGSAVGLFPVNHTEPL